ncbi:hypothetical protein D3C87_1483080 [compost metagenome]
MSIPNNKKVVLLLFGKTADEAHSFRSKVLALIHNYTPILTSLCSALDKINRIVNSVFDCSQFALSKLNTHYFKYGPDLRSLLAIECYSAANPTSQ